MIGIIAAMSCELERLVEAAEIKSKKSVYIKYSTIFFHLISETV